MAEKIYATGKRKETVAKVWLTVGDDSNFIVNGKEADKYFSCTHRYENAKKPLDVVELEDPVNIKVKVAGGGVTGQSDAIRLAIARALDSYDSDFHNKLKGAGLLTRDARVTERKKYGQPKARKQSQFSKR